MSIRYLLDTHAILWAIGAPRKLGAAARQVMARAVPVSLGIPAAALIEIGQLLHADKIDLGGKSPRDFFGGVPASARLARCRHCRACARAFHRIADV